MKLARYILIGVSATLFIMAVLYVAGCSFHVHLHLGDDGKSPTANEINSQMERALNASTSEE